jgi:hypothetical protein
MSNTKPSYEALLNGLRGLFIFCVEHGDFHSGVTNDTGTDEGEYYASQFLNEARELIRQALGDPQWIEHQDAWWRS